MLGENQILYRQIRQLDIPLCKEPTHSWGRPIDIGQETDEDRLTRRDNLDAIIVGNLNRMIPKFSMQMDLNSDVNKMKKEFNLCVEYGKAVHRKFLEMIENECKKMEDMERENEKRRVFKMEKVEELPKEIKYRIYDYLGHEEKVKFLLAKNNEWEKELLKKYTVVKLKNFYNTYYTKHMDLNLWKYDGMCKQLQISGWEVRKYLDMPESVAKKRGIYRKGDVTAYISFFIKKCIDARYPKTEREWYMYREIKKSLYEGVRSLIYMLKRCK